MNRILAVSDIHIHDYPNRNSFQFQRLYQGSRIVSENIINAGKESGSDYIVFCGDIIEKSIIRPYVMAEVYRFLHAIMKNFKEGWIIWGNHDIDNKSSDQEMTDSCLALFLPPNLHYMHRKYITLGDKVLGFNNWQPDIDLSWIPSKVDYLFTHARICYVKDSDLYQSQYLDESKFDLAFCGDIHKPGKIGKYVSIGIPQRCKMSDGEVCTGVVLEPETGKWTWINLNPKDNLMKFKYVDDRTKEGWEENTRTWNIFKPKTEELFSNSANSNIKISGWEKIESLVTDAITQAGLQELHQKVLTNIPNQDIGEVDFNFTPIKFYCKNWRSIDEATIYFQEGDKILVIGDNGSGKSSLLSAIKYAFCDVRSTPGLSSLKPFIQFGTKDCLTEMEFLYQGNKCRIRRGTKEYGLWINDESMKYSNKGDFELDCRRRFPFIEYIEVMIHDQDHNQFIGSLTGERLADIISKAFKLDRIDTYNDSAVSILDKLVKETLEWENKKKAVEEVKKFLDRKLEEIKLPKETRKELEDKKIEYQEIQEKSQKWSEYIKTSSRLATSIELGDTEIEKLKGVISKFRPQEEIDNDITLLQGTISSLQAQISDYRNLKNNIITKESELNNITILGKKLREEHDNINLENGICPTCNQVIELTPDVRNSLLKKKAELGESIKSKLEEYKKAYGELLSLRQKETVNTGEKIKELESEIMQKNKELADKISEKSEQKLTYNKLKELEKKQEEYRSQSESLKIPEKVELPEDFFKKLSEIELGIDSWKSWETNTEDKLKQDKLIKSYDDIISENKGKQEQLKEYINLTGPTGIIYKEVMKKLISQFNDNTVSYEINVREIRKKNHLTLIPQFYNNGNWVSYEACSGGQKTILDIHFLSKIINRVGILILDEFFKHLDPSNHDICLEMISEMSIGCTLISSHMESISNFNNKVCRLSLNQSGLTQIDIQ